jgi:hypothetical protein
MSLDTWLNKTARWWVSSKQGRKMSDYFKRFLNVTRLFIRSIGSGSADEQMRIFVEIPPSEIRDVVSKPINHIADGSSLIDNTCGYKSLNDAIVNAQSIGFSLLNKVKPENLLFVFGETIKSLQSSLREFCDIHLVSYPASDCYAPIYAEQHNRYNKNKPDPLAIVLCKVINSDMFQDTLIAKQQKGSDYCKRYEVSWGELQEFQKSIKDFVEHI